MDPDLRSYRAHPLGSANVLARVEAMADPDKLRGF